MLRCNEPKHAEQSGFIAWWDQAVGVRFAHGQPAKVARPAFGQLAALEKERGNRSPIPNRQKR